MNALRSLLPLVGCGVMMAVCMGLMGGKRRSRGSVEAQPAPTREGDPEVAALREEVARLRAERSEEPRPVDG